MGIINPHGTIKAQHADGPDWNLIAANVIKAGFFFLQQRKQLF